MVCWAPPMPTARSLLKMTDLQDSIYAIGGVNDNGEFLRTVERYDPAHHQWQTVAEMTTGRGNPGVTAIGNQIVVVGGAGGSLGSRQPLSSSEVYDPQHDSWQLLSAQLNPGRGSLTSASRPARTILAIGGSGPTNRVDGLQV
jgi:N-acetylneuraminic acid mutarotase